MFNLIQHDVRIKYRHQKVVNVIVIFCLVGTIAGAVYLHMRNCSKPLTVEPCRVGVKNNLRPIREERALKGSVRYNLTVNQPDLVDRSKEVKYVWVNDTQVGYYDRDQRATVSRMEDTGACECGVDFWYEILPSVRISRRVIETCIEGTCSWIPDRLRWATTVTMTNMNSLTAVTLVNVTHSERYLGFEIFGHKILEVVHLFAGITKEDNQLFINAYKDILAEAAKTYPCYQYSEVCPNTFEVIQYTAVNVTVLMSILAVIFRFVFRKEVISISTPHDPESLLAPLHVV